MIEARERRALTVVVLVFALLLASLFCASLVELRTRYEHDSFYRFLDWNLFLAWIPVALALIVYRASLAGLRIVSTGGGVLWLLFFPNAPYMLTDFIHLQESPTTPLWYDGLMLSAFAWTALLLGFFSLYLMQAVWRRSTGAALGWVGVVAALALASFGVYIGRFVGFNSWDALLHPARVARVIDRQVDNPLHHPRLFGSLAVLTAFLTVAYAIFYAFAGLRVQIARDLGRAALDAQRSRLKSRSI